jgi:hypothetical protein
VLLVKEERPLGFFASVGGALVLTALVLAWPLLMKTSRRG